MDSEGPPQQEPAPLPKRGSRCNYAIARKLRLWNSHVDGGLLLFKAGILLDPSFSCMILPLGINSSYKAGGQFLVKAGTTPEWQADGALLVQRGASLSEEEFLHETMRREFGREMTGE